LNAGALLQLAKPDCLNWSHDKDYILRLADRFCHTTLNPNPNRKSVSNFQKLLKKYCSLHQKFSHKKSRLYQPSRNNNAESPNNDDSHSRNSHSTRFILGLPNASTTNSVL